MVWHCWYSPFKLVCCHTLSPIPPAFTGCVISIVLCAMTATGAAMVAHVIFLVSVYRRHKQCLFGFVQSINQVYFQINMYKNEQKVHISQIDRKKVEVEVNNFVELLISYLC